MTDRIKSLSKRDFLKVASLATGALLSGCNFASPEEVTSTPTFVPTQTELPPTATATATEIPPTPTEVDRIPTLSREDMFKIGDIDLGTTPFTIFVSPETRRTLDHVADLNNIKYKSTDPMPIYLSGIYEHPDYVKKFEEAAINHGTKEDPNNPYFVVITDQDNHKLIVFHSAQDGVAGDWAREVARWVANNPDRVDQLYGQKAIIGFGDTADEDSQRKIEAEIVSAFSMSAEYFLDFENIGIWENMENKEHTMYGDTKKLLIPDSIRNDTNPNTFYLTIAGCSSEDGIISEIKSENVVRRALLTLKITLP